MAEFDCAAYSQQGSGSSAGGKSRRDPRANLQAAREVFSELGYDAATFQAIAVRSDLTRPAINHYFPSKRALYREVVDHTNAVVVQTGIERARSETTLLGRLSKFFAIAVQADSKDRSAAAFLVTSVLEAQRHPELSQDGHDPLASSREFVRWAVGAAVDTGELTADVDIDAVVEMLVALMWGMGFYSGYVGTHDRSEAVIAQLELLLANKLFRPVG